MTDLTDLALEIPCAYCGAAPGAWCVTRIMICRAMPRATAIKHFGPSGRAAYLHADRTRPIWRAYWAGITDAHNYGNTARADG